MPDSTLEDLASLKIERGAPSQPRKWSRAPLVVGAAAALGACSWAAATWLKATLLKPEIELTEIAVLSPARAVSKLTSAGYVVPQQVARPGVKTTARLAEARVREGQVVTAGQVIAVFEDAAERRGLATAESRAAAATARAQAAWASSEELKQQIERERLLVDGGSNARAKLEDMTVRARALEMTAKAAEADARAAAAEVESSRAALRENTVVAPIDGTVVSKPPQVGEIVGAQTPIVEIVNFGSLMMETDVPEGRLHQLQIGGPAEIVLDAYPSRSLRGAVAEIGRRVNRAKATVPVKVKFTDGADGVLPDMAGRVSFLERELSAEAMKEPPRHLVPGSAVVERDGKPVVFTVEQGRARAVPVTLGAPMAGGFELLRGPPPGTKVVDRPAATLAEGQNLKVRERD
jgi:RND family efflux transporter MFP subunit